MKCDNPDTEHPGFPCAHPANIFLPPWPFTLAEYSPSGVEDFWHIGDAEPVSLLDGMPRFLSEHEVNDSLADDEGFDFDDIPDMWNEYRSQTINRLSR